jgi:hypothetical protein
MFKYAFRKKSLLPHNIEWVQGQAWWEWEVGLKKKNAEKAGFREPGHSLNVEFGGEEKRVHGALISQFNL